MTRKEKTSQQNHIPGATYYQTAYGVFYRGYLIRSGLIGDYFIGKDGFWIACVKSLDAAKKAIDELID